MPEKRFSHCPELYYHAPNRSGPTAVNEP